MNIEQQQQNAELMGSPSSSLTSVLGKRLAIDAGLAPSDQKCAELGSTRQYKK